LCGEQVRSLPVRERFDCLILLWISRLCCLITKSPEQTAVGAVSSLSRFTPRVGGGSAFFVRPLYMRYTIPILFVAATLLAGCQSPPVPGGFQPTAAPHRSAMLIASFGTKSDGHWKIPCRKPH